MSLLSYTTLVLACLTSLDTVRARPNSRRALANPEPRWNVRIQPRQSATVGTDTLPESTVELVAARLAESAQGSWENGTQAQALLEYHFPELAVWHSTCLPVSMPTDNLTSNIPTNTNSIANTTMRQKMVNPAATLMFVQDSSAADPASLGISIILANATVPELDYWWAVNDENDWLFNRAPRTSDGAVSHRVSEVQLWSDFVAMVPPYLAYHGAMLGNDSTMLAAYDQIRLYRQYLTNGTGLWRHILLGDPTVVDVGYWATGNAWAAWGMLRVLASMINSSYRDRYLDLQANLKTWVVQTITDSFASLNTTTNLLPNYLQENTFPDASSSALLAACSYRLAQLNLDNSTLATAETIRRSVYSNIDESTGWLRNIVDPHNWAIPGTTSPEGQAFVIILAASHRDYLNSR